MSKSKHNPSEVQLSLFDYNPHQGENTTPANDDYPMIVSRNWKFNLAFIDTPKGRYYHAVQWLSGLGASDRESWSRLKKQLLVSNSQLEIQVLPYTATNNKTYEVDFISEQSCYLVAQNMRLTKKRPQLKEIQDYLAKSGCFVNWVNQNPEQDTNRALDREITILVSSRGMTPEQARKHAMRRQSVRIARNALTDKLKFHVIDKINYATFTDKAEYKPLFNRVAKEISAITGVSDARDGMTTEALAFLEIAELTFARQIETKGSITFQEACELMIAITAPLGLSIQAMERITGVDLATGQKLLKTHYDYE